MKVTIQIPPTLVTRVKRAAEMRGLDVETYVLTMLTWHSPAYDNDAQYLRDRIKALVKKYEAEYEYGDVLNDIEEIVR